MKHWKAVTREHLPSLSKLGTQEILKTLEVKGAAMEASASEREIPTSAYYKAAQSLAPSPHIPMAAGVIFCKLEMRVCLSTGVIRA